MGEKTNKLMNMYIVQVQKYLTHYMDQQHAQIILGRLSSSNEFHGL